MPLTYAIADLHGRFDLLVGALMQITQHANDRPYKVITLGDYVDRGPQSCQIIQHLIDAQACGRPLICLKGNHEEIMRLSCRKLPSAEWWLSNGGGHTLLSYGHVREGRVNVKVVPDAHLDWVEQLPLMHIDQHRVYVHAGVDRHIPLEGQAALTDMHGNQKILWKLYGNDDEGGHGYRHVVHGHHQFKDGPICKKGRTDLDTFAWYTGRLVIGVFDDDIPGGPIDFIEIRRSTA